MLCVSSVFCFLWDRQQPDQDLILQRSDGMVDCVAGSGEHSGTAIWMEATANKMETCLSRPPPVNTMNFPRWLPDLIRGKNSLQTLAKTQWEYLWMLISDYSDNQSFTWTVCYHQNCLRKIQKSHGKFYWRRWTSWTMEVCLSNWKYASPQPVNCADHIIWLRMYLSE